MDLMSLFDHLNRGALGWGVIAVAILSCIQIAPIKLNPWSFMAKHLGKALTEEPCKIMAGNMSQLETSLVEIEKSVRALEKKLEETEDKAEEDRAITARVRILRFNDELLRPMRHSKESFDQALEDVDRYENYCRAHPEFKNNKTVLSIANIKKVYKRQLATHDFLVNGEEE